MFKKLSIVMIIFVMVTMMFVGCTGSQPAEEEKLTVGFLYVGPIGDGGYTYAHDQGRVYLEEELGVKTIYKESVPEDKGEVIKTIRDMVDQGATVIFGTSFGFMQGMAELSAEFENVTFMHCSGYMTTDNMNNYFGRMYEPRYLSGIVAAMKTESNKIGYVAAFPIYEVIRGINAFTLGAKSVNPDIEVQVMWTNTWYDPAKEKDAAVALLDQGCDVISQHQDTTGPIQAAAEAGATAIGYNSSAAEAVPEAYITAPVWNWGPYYVSAVQAVIDGTWTNDPYWGGLNDGVVQLDELTELTPEGAKEKVAEVKEAIKLGELKVFSGEIKDQDGNVKVEAGQELTDGEMLSMDWFVEGVVGTIPETK